MRIRDQLKMIGNVVIKEFDENGICIKTTRIPNTIVTTGKQYIASRMVGTSSPVMSHMAIGSGSSLPDVSQTALQTQLGIVTLGSFSANSNVVSATAVFPAGTGTGGIVEAGIFNDSDSDKVMLCRTTFPVVNKSALTSISISWSITVS